ncbi:MAG: HlyD family efflux transporter periplasmic adaptor subunit [Phycisphaeraceae bacterium]|nr:HlyD family efflux transporter periplasmic adaptor subunit [Phycisphaeraceae bacterium]
MNALKQLFSACRTRWAGLSRGRAWTVGACVAIAAVILLLKLSSSTADVAGPSQANATTLSDAPETSSPRPSVNWGEWYEVQKRSFDVTVAASGELEPKDKVEIKCLVDGQTSIVELIDEGKAVSAGDLLARLADDDIRSKLDQESLQFEQAQADDVSAQENLAIQKNQARSDESETRRKLEMAKLELAKWEQGTDPQKKRELQLAHEKAKRELTRARRDVDLSQQLYSENFISLNELEDDQIKLIEAENALATAELDIEVYEQFTRPKELRDVQSAVELAESALDNTIRKNASELARKEADLQSKRRTLKMRQDKLDQLNKQLEQTVIRAPQDGLVVYGTSVGGSRWGRSDPLAVGRQVGMNELLFMLPDMRQMVASVQVHESMLTRVQVGQRARVTVDARAGQVIEGQVTQIGVMAESNRWWNPDLREYRVRVDLPPGVDDSLKPAMRCTTEILVDHVQDALAVPVQAVYARGNQRIVYVASGSQVVARPVTLGRTSDMFAEITDGLELGQRVLLREPRPGEVAGG